MTAESFSTPARASEISKVRRHVPVALAKVGVKLPPDDADTVVLLVSELATNAVVHGSHGDDPSATLTIEFTFIRPTRRLRVQVLDAGRGRPRRKIAGPEAEDGRGLFLVAQLAIDHGTEVVEGGGTIVWFEVPVATGPVGTEPGGRPSTSSHGTAGRRAPEQGRQRDPLGAAITACWAAGHVIVLGLLGQVVNQSVEATPALPPIVPFAAVDAAADA
ncbi:ATP-binding protein [Kitasatospora sp. NPDC057015]|uniref:ATP-binding protein n=1 Tax=Kitasatospora sp. NPDC057015 TaxID=3346001 RepID=UPI00363BEACF